MKSKLMPIPVMLLILLFTLPAYTSFKDLSKSKVYHSLTVKSQTASVELFDLLIISGDEKDQHFFKREYSLETPYELVLEPGDYIIIINRISEKGELTGKVELIDDGSVKGWAQSENKIMVMNIKKDGSYTASGI